MPDKGWDLSDPKQRMCYELSNIVLDEHEATEEYHKKAKEFSESDNPGIRALGILMDKLADDEQSHEKALTRVTRLVCPI